MGFIDDLFDKAESVLDGADRLANTSDGEWTVEDFFDDDDRKKFLIKSESGKKLETRDEELANRVCKLLTGKSDNDKE